jgi:hypothetical protein
MIFKEIDMYSYVPKEPVFVELPVGHDQISE